jgi:hypothetical protein
MWRKNITFRKGVEGKDIHRFSQRNREDMALERNGGTLADYALATDGLPA